MQGGAHVSNSKQAGATARAAPARARSAPARDAKPSPRAAGVVVPSESPLRGAARGVPCVSCARGGGERLQRAASPCLRVRAARLPPLPLTPLPPRPTPRPPTLFVVLSAWSSADLAARLARRASQRCSAIHVLPTLSPDAARCSSATSFAWSRLASCGGAPGAEVAWGADVGSARRAGLRRGGGRARLLLRRGRAAAEAARRAPAGTARRGACRAAVQRSTPPLQQGDWGACESIEPALGVAGRAARESGLLQRNLEALEPRLWLWGHRAGGGRREACTRAAVRASGRVARWPAKDAVLKRRGAWHGGNECTRS